MGWKDIWSRRDIDAAVEYSESQRAHEKALRKAGKTKEADKVKEQNEKDDEYLKGIIEGIGRENQQEPQQRRGSGNGGGEQKNKHTLPRAATRNNYESGIRTFSTKSGRCMCAKTSMECCCGFLMARVRIARNRWIRTGAPLPSKPVSDRPADTRSFRPACSLPSKAIRPAAAPLALVPQPEPSALLAWFSCTPHAVSQKLSQPDGE
jgi:hypothetical protein